MNDRRGAAQIYLGIEGLIAAILCLLPVYQQSDFVNNDFSVDVVRNSIRSDAFRVSVLMSIAASIPIMIQMIIEFFQQWHVHELKAYFAWFLPRYSFILVLVISDLVIMTHVIPFADARLLPCLWNAREVFILHIFLVYSNTLGKPVISPVRTTFIGLLASAVYISYTIGYFSENSQSMYYMSFGIVLFSVAITLVGYETCNWFKTILGSQIDQESFSLSIYLAGFIPAYTSVFFLPFVFHRRHWMQSSPNYLATYTYIEMFFILILTVANLQLTRREIIITKGLLEGKKSFLRYISHEIRTPLTTVLLGLKLMEEQALVSYAEDSHDLIELINEIQSSCDVAVNVLNDFLLFDKVETGNLILEKEHFNLLEFVIETVKPFDIQARRCEVNLSVTCDPSEITDGVMLFADRNKLSQVVRNLVSNGLKFTPPNGYVTVHICLVAGDLLQELNNFHDARGGEDYGNKVGFPYYKDEQIASANQQTHWIRITCTDTGPGISKENQDKLFRSVVQFNPGKLQRGGGSGLGLLFSKGIVDRHGGRIDVYSDGEGFGSSFFLDLPCEIVPNDPEAPAMMAPMDVEANNFFHKEPERKQAVQTKKSLSPFIQRLRKVLRYFSTKQRASVPVSMPIPVSSRTKRQSFANMSFSSIGLDQISTTRKHVQIHSTNSQVVWPLISESNNSSVRHFGGNSMNIMKRDEDIEVLNSLDLLQGETRNQPFVDLENSPSYRDDRGDEKQSISDVDLVPETQSCPDGGTQHREMESKSIPSKQIGMFQTHSEELIFTRANPAMGFTMSKGMSVPVQCRILVVDDAIFNRKMICRILATRGIVTMEAADGLIAVRMLRQSMEGKSDNIDIVLLDFQMPVMDGPTAAKEMRAMGYKGKILGLTGHALPLDISHFINQGADRVLLKPLNIAELDEILASRLPLKGSDPTWSIRI